jgi:hypothetical protein
MSQYETLDPEKEVPCPYDNTHMIRVKRMPYHIRKCRKNHIDMDLGTCPFNARHRIPRVEMRYHIADCADKAILEQDILYAQQKAEANENQYKGNTDVPPYNRGMDHRVLTEEDWDDDVSQIPKLTLPKASTEGTSRFKDVSFMTPSEKKAYYKRLKINYERKQQGLPELEDEEEPPLQVPASSVSGMRLPRDKPQVIQRAPPAKPKAPKVT